MKDVIDPAAMQSLCDALEAEFAWLHPSDPEAKMKARAEVKVGDAAQRLEALNRRIDDLSGEHVQSALCLSGGGIRSATFCLGALQGLAQVELMNQFHYLSTVLGGGYIGGWLSSWVQREGLPAVVQALAGIEPGTPPTASPTACPADQGALAFDVQRLVDGLLPNPHRLVVRKVQTQPLDNLLRASGACPTPVLKRSVTTASPSFTGANTFTALGLHSFVLPFLDNGAQRGVDGELGSL